MDFASTIDAWCDDAEGRIETVIRYTLMEVARRLVMRTPVGMPHLWVRRRAPPGYRPGQARAGWHYSTSAPVVALPTAPDASGLTTFNRLVSSLPRERLGGKVHFFSNNVSYIEELERGHSRLQAPSGMVGITAMEVDTIVAQGILTLPTKPGKVSVSV